MSNLLAVDFDYFFPNPWGGPARSDILLWDWNHRESPFHIGPVWYSRAEGFINNNLPLPGLSGEQETFWRRGFKFSRRPRFFYGESNVFAVNTGVTGTRRSRRNWDHVYLYDAHHDSGYNQGQNPIELASEGRWSCENWTVLYWAIGAQIHVRYPAWGPWLTDADPEPIIQIDRQIDTGEVPDVEFDTVFVCRSGAWVPPWHDSAYERFIDAAPFKAKHDFSPEWPNREFDLEAARLSAQKSKEMIMAEFAGKTKIALAS